MHAHTFKKVVFFPVCTYLEQFHAQNMSNAVGVNTVPTGNHIRDDEQVRLITFYSCSEI